MTIMNIDWVTEVGNSTADQGDRRRYRSPRRQQQAAETREAIANAARELFAAHGWAGTRVRDVARHAGVAEPTVYAAYGSKAGLARALVDAVELSAEIPDLMERLRSAGSDPAEELATLTHSDRLLFERGGDIIALLRQAGDSEPDLHAAYQQARQRADELRRSVFETWPGDVFRDGVDPQGAVDTFAAICNIDVYRILVEERGWSPGHIEQWWGDTLARLLFRE